jgi:glutathione S-transferase
MYKIYERPGGGNTVVEAVLAEANQPFELIHVPRNADTSIPAWFRDVNPRGEVPVLVLPGGQLMMESAAITIHLADIYPEAKLAPALNDTNRARYLQWILFFATTAYGTELRCFYPQNFSDDQESHAGIRNKALAERDQIHAIFARAVGKGPYILGETFSAADIYAAMLIGWAENLTASFERHSNLKDYYHRVLSRPKIKAVFQRNNLPV